MDTEMDCDSGGDSTATTASHPMNLRNASRVSTGLHFMSGDMSSGQPYSTQSLSRRLAPNSIGLQMTPTKTLLMNQRRSSSGIFITSMFGSRFRHLQKLHSEAFLGLNSICMPGLPLGAVFRSSLPATPVATPVHREAFQQFTEQALRDRLCRTPSPRKTHSFLAPSDHRMRRESGGSNISADESGMCDVQPMDIASPIDEPVLEDPKGEEGGNGATGFDGQHYFGRTGRLHRRPSDEDLTDREDTSGGTERRLFVGNISYRVTDTELSKFFQKFGKVYNCCIVQDHIQKLPKGYGFITFKRVSDLQKCLNADPNELVLDYRQLRVFLAKPKAFKQMKSEVQELCRERDLSLEYRSRCTESTESMDNQMSALVLLRKSADESVTTFDHLDDDSILNVFAHLDTLIERTVVESVCKRWQSLMHGFWASRTHISFTQTFFHFESPALTSNILFSILKKCPNLKSIDLKCVTNFLDFKALEIIAVSCPLLERLVYDSGPTTDYTIKILGQKCPNLKILCLNCCTNFGEEGFWWLLKSAKQLQHLEVTNNHKINGNCFRLLAPTLQKLDITDCPKIKEKGIKELIGGQRTALESLNITPLSGKVMEMICLNLKNLKVLRMSQSQASDESIYGFSSISSLENLEILDNSSHFSDISDESLLLIISKCLKLKELLLVLNSRVTDQSISQIPKHLPHLQRLHISDTKITDESLKKLSHLQSLVYLDLSGSHFVTDTGLEFMVENCHSLESLQLLRCEHISIEFLKFCVQFIQTRDDSTLNRDLKINFNKFQVNAKRDTLDDIDYYYRDRDEFYDDYDNYSDDNRDNVADSDP